MLTPARIRPHVLHDDRYVRRAAVEYLAESWSKDGTVVSDILRLCRQSGAERSLLELSWCHRFPMTEDDLVGMLELLSGSTEETVQFHLNQVLGNAPIESLARHETLIHETPLVLKETQDRIRHRSEFASWSGDRLWQELQNYVRRSENLRYCNEIDQDYLDALVEILAKHEVPDAATICDLMNQDVENDADGWREVFTIDLAGERRVPEAVPILVDKFRVDTDYMLDRASRALAKIGDPQAARRIQETFLKETWDFKNFATGALGAIKSPESEDAILALLEFEPDVEIRTMLCHQLCQLFSERGIEVVCRQIQAGYDGWVVNLEESLLPVIDVLGFELPEADRWRTEREEREAASEERRRNLGSSSLKPATDRRDRDDSFGPQPTWASTAVEAISPLRAETRVGRNERCPCGSGKKYKKCCGKS